MAVFDFSRGIALLSRVNLPLVLAYVLVFAALLVYFDSFCRAMAPRSGTIEWISMYDRPRLSFSGLYHPLSRGDFWPMLAYSVLSAGLCAFGAVLLIRQGGISASEVLLCPDALLTGRGGCAVFCGLSLLPCYLLLRALTGRTDAAAGATALFALALIPSGAPYSFSVPLALLSVWCFVRALSAEDAPARVCALWLAAAGVLFYLAVWAEHITLWFGIAYVPVFLLALVLRIRARKLSAGGALALIVTFLLVCTVPAVLIRLPSAVLERGMRLPDCLALSSFWRFVWVQTLSFRIYIDPLSLLGATLLHPLLWWGGLLAAFCAAAYALSRRSASALLTVAFYLAGTLVWVFSGSALGAAVCALVLGFVLAHLLARGCAARAYAYCLVCLLLGAALPALALLA